MISENVLEICTFLLSFVVISHASIIINLVINGLDSRNLRNLIYLLLSMAAYPAFHLMFFVTGNYTIQKIAGLAGVAIVFTATFFLINFPEKNKANKSVRPLYYLTPIVSLLSIYPGFWPDTKLVDNSTVSAHAFLSGYIFGIYVLYAIILIAHDAFYMGSRTRGRTKKIMFWYFMSFALIASMVDVFIPLFLPKLPVLFTIIAPTSSIIFALGLYSEFQKTRNGLTKNSYASLLTVFLVLQLVFYLLTDNQTHLLFRVVMLLIAVKVGYDTIHQIRKEHDEHDSLKRDHQANMLFISDIAHRLKTPLAIIQFKTAPDQPYTKEAREEVHEVAKTTVATLRNIVQTGKIDAELAELSRKTINLQDWVREQQAQIEDLAPNHSVRLITQGHTLVSIDQLYMREALYNIVDNARKFSPKGSMITVSVTSDNKSCILSVHNTGSTIHQKDLPHIFDRHYQSDGTRQKFAGSAGLGLSLVKWVAEAHNGSVNATSTSTDGTTFTIIVPLAKRTTAPHKAIKKIITEG